jgi:hypothetical protein
MSSSSQLDRRTDLAGRPSFDVHPTISMTPGSLSGSFHSGATVRYIVVLCWSVREARVVIAAPTTDTCAGAIRKHIGDIGSCQVGAVSGLSAKRGMITPDLEFQNIEFDEWS